MAKTALELVNLQADEEFLARLQLAFMAVAYQTVANAKPGTESDKARLAALSGVRYLVQDPANVRELAKRSLLLFLGNPAIAADPLGASDIDLATVAGTILAGLQEYTLLGGTLA